MKNWPAWRKKHGDELIPQIRGSVKKIFATNRVEVVLTGHSGGGSLTFGYLNAIESIPDDVERIAFLDSNYAYETTNHLTKLSEWLRRTCERTSKKPIDAPLTPSLSPSDGERVVGRLGEPLKVELQHFVECVCKRQTLMVNSESAKRALDLAFENTRQVQQSK